MTIFDAGSFILGILTQCLCVLLGLAGLVGDIIMLKFAFVANFHPPNKLPYLRTVA